MNAPKTQSRCLYPTCRNRPITRGLCPACYKVAQSLVLAGFTSWETLEGAGKAKPLRRRRAEKTKQGWFLGRRGLL